MGSVAGRANFVFLRIGAEPVGQKWIKSLSTFAGGVVAVAVAVVAVVGEGVVGGGGETATSEAIKIVICNGAWHRGILRVGSCNCKMCVCGL